MNDNSTPLDSDWGLNDNRVVTGLWQVADLERDGTELNRERAAGQLLAYAADGFCCFDMADHYGSAELIAGSARRRLAASDPAAAERLKLFTKWCPEPHQRTPDAVREGIAQRCERLGVERIDLLQLHWWSFDHPGYIDVMDTLTALQREGRIDRIGVTNFDTDHLHLLLAEGYGIASNQVCLSVLDRRALGDMSALCRERGVRLLAYGTLAGGFLSERWLGQPRPDAVDDWSKMKYLRFIDAVGGWEALQQVLTALSRIAARHGVTIANVATRWAVQQQAVAAAIVGARIAEREHRQSNKSLATFTLSAQDMTEIDAVSSALTPIPGDCGSEYRRPPFLTASGDLSHHLDALPPVYAKTAVPGREHRWRISSGSEFEPVCGYSRALRDGDRIVVSGTTATHGEDRAIGDGDVRAQTTYILDKISASLAALGGSLDDVVRTRIYMTDCEQWSSVARVHGRYFGDALPANTLVEISRLVGPYQVEIEAEAVVRRV